MEKQIEFLIETLKLVMIFQDCKPPDLSFNCSLCFNSHGQSASISQAANSQTPKANQLPIYRQVIPKQLSVVAAHQVLSPIWSKACHSVSLQFMLFNFVYN